MGDFSWKLATIKHASLGNEDHGILTSYLHLEWPGGGQGFGGLGLGRTKLEPSDRDKWTHEGFHPYLYRWVTGVLRTMQCGWEDLSGKRLWLLSGWTSALAIRSEDGRRTFWLTEGVEAEHAGVEYEMAAPWR